MTFYRMMKSKAHSHNGDLITLFHCCFSKLFLDHVGDLAALARQDHFYSVSTLLLGVALRKNTAAVILRLSESSLLGAS